MSEIGSNLDLLMREFSTITHNMANVNTTGFKRRTNAFAAALEAQQARLGNQSSPDLEMHAGLDFSQGHLMQTGRPLDLALSGKGFFMLETPTEPLYTRNGVFHLNENNQIVDAENRLVSGQGGPITIPPTVDMSSLYVSPEGNIQAGDLSLGSLQLVDFGTDEGKLQSVGTAAFRAPAEVTSADATNVTVRYKFQEASNVQMVPELVGMITVSRLYDANMKYIAAKRESGQSMMNVAMG
jgi:flagellar basal-body rod protein FlgF